MSRRGLHWMIVVMALVVASCGDDPAPKAAGPVGIPLDDLTSEERVLADAMLADLQSSGPIRAELGVDEVFGCTVRASAPELSDEAKRLIEAGPMEALADADDALLYDSFDACAPEGLVGELFVEVIALEVAADGGPTFDAEERACLVADYRYRFPDDSIQDLERLPEVDPEGTMLNTMLSRCAGKETATTLMSVALTASPDLAGEADCLAARVVADLGPAAVMEDLLSTTDALGSAVQRALDEAMVFC